MIKSIGSYRDFVVSSMKHYDWTQSDEINNKYSILFSIWYRSPRNQKNPSCSLLAYICQRGWGDCKTTILSQFLSSSAWFDDVFMTHIFSLRGVRKQIIFGHFHIINTSCDFPNWNWLFSSICLTGLSI